MATQFDTQIQQLYVAYFNRPADAAGIAHWANFLTNGGTTAQISAAFATSMEYQTAYSQTTNAGVVTAIYQNLFGRSPEAAGLAFWVKALNDKSITVDNMVTTIASAAQTTDKVAFDSKVKVATAFTAALDTDAEIAGYSGDLANAVAKNLLSTIKTDAQANAAIVPATLNASIAAVVKASVPFTLEVGLARLDAANKAVVDFLAGATIDLNDDGVADKNVTEANIATNLSNAQADVATLVNDAAYTNPATAETVKAAIVAAKVAAAAKGVEDMQGKLTTEVAALNAKAGLANAVATSTSAAAVAKTAADALTLASSTQFGAEAILTRNADLRVNANGTVDLMKDDGQGGQVVDKAVVSLNDSGVLALATGVKATDFDGAAGYITATNAEIAAIRADADAADAAALAQVRVETIDLNAANGGTLLSNLSAAFKLGGPVVPAKTGAATADEIAAQLNGLKATAIAAREAADGAPNDTGLQQAATAAEKDVGDFRIAVKTFNDANTTTLADAVKTAETNVKTAQDFYDDLEEAIAGLSTADALSKGLKTVVDAQKVAVADFAANKFAAPEAVKLTANFGTAGNDIFLASKDVTAATITSFGLQGDDVLYIGSGYTLNAGKVEDGNNAVLEVFFSQKGSSTVVTIETKVYGSESADVHTITLTGVNAADLTFENGIISL